MGFLDKLVIAAIEQGETAELEKLLKTGGANARAENDKGLPAMHVAAALDNVAAMAVLERYGAGIHTLDNDGNSPLLIASAEGKIEAAKFLLGKGALSNVRNKKTETALHLAAKNGRRAVVELFAVEAKYMLDFTTADGRTAMMMAAEKDYAQTVKALIGAGADAHAIDGRGWTAAEWAQKGGAKNAERLLGAHGAGNPMQYGLGHDVIAPEKAHFNSKKLKRLSP